MAVTMLRFPTIKGKYPHSRSLQAYPLLIVAVALYILASNHLSPLVDKRLAPLAQVLKSPPSTNAPTFPILYELPTVITLHFKTPWDAPYVEHNCIQATRAGARIVIYTDNIKYRYCQSCQCEKFEPTQCKPPNPRPNSMNNCEKLTLIAALVPRLRAFVYLDADLIVTRRSFFKRLAIRSFAHDFLATPGHMSYTKVHNYRVDVNSGLFFIRYVPSANYSDLVPLMYRMRNGNDQSVISKFVHKHYENWDSLSWKWHCRSMLRFNWDIPLSDCYTIHDRNERKSLLKTLNYTLSTL